MIDPKDHDDDRPFDGLVRDPSQPSRDLLPPLGMTLEPDDRAWLVRRYGEAVTRDWERRNAEFIRRLG